MAKRLREKDEEVELDDWRSTTTTETTTVLGKRLRRTKPVCYCCASPPPPPSPPHPHPDPRPRLSFLTRHPGFSWYEEDAWTEIAKHLDGKSLVMLAATSQWFRHIAMEDCIWKFVCLRDLQVTEPKNVGFKWIKLYASAFNGSHSYVFRQQEKHIDWKRIGAFSFDSPFAYLTEKLICPVKLRLETVEKMLQSYGCCVLKNVKTGIWIADLQLLRCPVCHLNTCDGTMQTLDARHIELFLKEGYQDGSWEYEMIGTLDNTKQETGASCGIFDIKYLKSSLSSAVFNLKSWVGEPNDWQPKAMLTYHAVAINTNLPPHNDGLHAKFHIMTEGAGGEVVSIRISQQLL